MSADVIPTEPRAGTVSHGRLWWIAFVLVVVPVAAPYPSRRPSWVIRIIATVLQIAILVVGIRLLLSDDAATEFAESSTALGLAALALLVLAALKTWSAVEFSRWVSTQRRRPHRGVTALVAVVVTACSIVVPVTASGALLETRTTLSDVFSGSPDDGPVAVPSPLSTTSTTSTTEPPTDDAAAQPPPSTVGPTTTSTTVAPIPIDEGRWNVLLLGVDSGVGRGTRLTDAMLIVSVDEVTGDLAVVSVPRDSRSTPMPPGPLSAEFPDGYGGKTNEIYNYGYKHPEVNPSIDDPTTRGAWLISSALAELTGLTIDDWVVVNMAGFVDLIDAIGPIEVWAPKRVPLPGNPPDAKHPVPAYFDAGWHTFDGTDALAYSRSRYGDSDFQRIARQRCVLAATAERLTPTNLMSSWLSFLGAISRSVRTSIAQESLSELRDLVGQVDIGAGRALSLAPPAFDPYRPDVAYARQLVAATIKPGGVPPTTVPDPGPATTTPRPGPATTAPQVPPTTTPPIDDPSTVLSATCRP